jgi:GT2 family glycosyltransferase
VSRLLVSIVTYNSEDYISRCLGALLDQSNLNFSVLVVDNASTDRTTKLVKEFISKLQGRIQVTLLEMPVNLGFCGGHNRSTKLFLDNPSNEWILFLNPDLRLAPDAIAEFYDAIKINSVDIVTPKLFRADSDLQPVEPKLIDAAGMILTKQLRHFDRGSNQKDIYSVKQQIFGGTGACLFISKQAVNALLLKSEKFEQDIYKVFPDLAFEYGNRAPLFDEAFFAYREDADLCWRANLLGLSTTFIPQIIGYHRRVVLPSNRSSLSSKLNGLSVANRFLLQTNNYFFTNSIISLLVGVLFRNIVVIFAVFLMEIKSIPYLLRLKYLIPRALDRRRILRSKVKSCKKII